MERSRADKLIDYFPLLAYLGFWLQGALIPALIIGDTKLILLGLITVPALLALSLAAVKITSKSERKFKRGERGVNSFT